MARAILARARSLWQGIRRRGTVEAEMAEEFRLHLELRAADLARAGLTPAEAARQAKLEFGCAELHKDDARAARGLRPFDQTRISWLDLKLGFRMLVKYPGLTVVGGLAFAFAIWVAAGAFEFVGQVLEPRLPLPGGERIVALESWDAAAGRAEPRVLHDFAAWRAELKSLQDLGAYRLAQRNLVTPDGESLPTEVAEISASAFRVASGRPLLGRALAESDERPEAPAVAVIGHDVWQGRFGGDRSVVGRVVRLGRTPTTVVGVMPEGYAFPVSQSLWVPLRVRALDYPVGQGPALRLFGRLAPGVTFAEAQAELTTWGRRAAADFPSTHRHLRPRVLPYAKSFSLVGGLSGPELLLIGSSYVFFVMLLVLICGNVALLVFARAATREAELVVRNALGASRGRIVAQLFAAGLTVLGAAIAGVLPGVKVTRGLQARLRQATAGAGGLTFGGIWTVVIVAQIAVTLAFPTPVYYMRRDQANVREMVVNFPEAEFLSARIELDREPPPPGQGRGQAGADTSLVAYFERRRTTAQELERRLRAEPGVVGVTLAERLPRMDHPPRKIEVDPGGAAPEDPRFPGGYRVSSSVVDADYFAVLGAPLRAGRAFHSGDLAPRARTVIVNESFVRLVLGGRNPIGRHLRYRARSPYSSAEEARAAAAGGEESDSWHEIVGVAPDLGTSKSSDPKVAGIYHPLALDVVVPLHLAIHVRGDPAAFAPRLRAVAAAVDPTLRVDAVAPMDTLSDAELQFGAFWIWLLTGVSAVAMLLSLSAIYAVMTFTVARRTREIGVRVALGASRREVVTAVFARPLAQVALGVAAGGVLTGMLKRSASAVNVVGTLEYAVLMFAVCLLACVVPTRRALAVEPTEALRADG